MTHYSSPLKAWLSAHLWWLLLTLVGLGGLLSLSIDWLRALLAGGISTAPAPGTDDVVYYQMMASGQLCFHNLTSVLAEGGCRVRPLWSLAGWLSPLPGLGELSVRLLAYGAFVVALGLGASQWARRLGTDHATTRNWVVALVVLGPFPLVMVTSYVLTVPEFTLLGSLLYSLPNLVSWLLYVVAVGGLYVWRDRPATWPIWGLFLGLWGLHHPYFIGFIVTLLVVWLLQLYRLAFRHLLATAGLIIPVMLAGGYYVWLYAVNEFFRFHVTTNVTLHYPGMMWWLLGAVIVTLSLVRLRQEPFVMTWIAVAMLWQVIPGATERRLVLLLALPVAIFVTLACVQKTLAGRKLRLGMGAMMVMNVLILAALAAAQISSSLNPASNRYVVTRSDEAFGRELRALGSNGYYISDGEATARFLWLSQVKILNAHHHESPDYGLWNQYIKQAAAGKLPCDQMALDLARRHVSGVILARSPHSSVASEFERCGLAVKLQNGNWVMLEAQQRR